MYSAVVWYVAFPPCAVAVFGASARETGCKEQLYLTIKYRAGSAGRSDVSRGLPRSGVVKLAEVEL